MANVSGKTQKAPSGPFWYWTQLGPDNVNLVDRTVALPPGTYDLHWDFRGKSGESLSVTITDDSGRVLTNFSDSIAPNDSESWGQKSFKVLP